jgi:hypothetical protein
MEGISAQVEKMSDARLYLRVHDITNIIFDGHNSHSQFDVEVSGASGHWYLRIPESGRVYCVEVGFKAGGLSFIPAARSNPLWLPRDGPSGSSEEHWSTIKLD